MICFKNNGGTTDIATWLEEELGSEVAMGIYYDCHFKRGKAYLKSR
jgi:hypothetical protein